MRLMKFSWVKVIVNFVIKTSVFSEEMLKMTEYEAVKMISEKYAVKIDEKIKAVFKMIVVVVVATSMQCLLCLQFHSITVSKICEHVIIKFSIYYSL